jgi:peptidoglycan/xylan/chitin deacetylase (PgdA/CDA1 family)
VTGLPARLAPLARPPLVLAYHGLGAVRRELDPTGLMVPVAQFRRLVGQLKARGYEFVTQAEFARRMHASEPLTGVCSLTFDDGSVDNHRELPGLLDDLEVPATIFICPDRLGEPYPWLPPEAGVRLMGLEELLELAELPSVEIGAHTLAHTDLGGADLETAYEEMCRCRERLGEMLGELPVSFAYPGGAYSKACPVAAERAGYTSAVTTGPRGGLRPYELWRQSPDPYDGPLVTSLKTRGMYHRLRERTPIRLARNVTRAWRHRSSRSAAP